MITNKLIVITGASSGIGAELANVFSKQGYFVGLISRQQTAISHLDPKRSIAVSADVRNFDQLSKAIAKMEAQFGGVACLINNAGALIPGAFEDLKSEQFQQMMDVNVQGVMHGIQSVLPGMLQRQHGTIINISSLADRCSRPHNAVYAASKAAVKSLTESLRAAYSKKGIRFCNVAPAKIRTPMMQQTGLSADELISTAEMANIILWLYQQPKHICIRDIVVAPTAYEQ